jgi:WhiB family redox-sensing transcriptional regulator
MNSHEQSQKNWQNLAACRDEDPELFFPVGNTGPALMQIEEARAVCNRCSVADICLKWAIETGQDAGVWGGLSEDERRALKRREARKAINKRHSTGKSSGITFGEINTDDYVVPYEQQPPDDDF